MSEIKVGEYVRTSIGKIYKLTEKKQEQIENYPKFLQYIEQKSIVKHSFNIADLIEKGDVIEINNQKYEVIYDESYEKLGVLIPNRNHLSTRHCAIEYIFSKQGIEEFCKIRIVTHEQFQSLEYRLEE